MPTIYINKENAKTESTISIGFAYDATILHYLKKRFTNPKYNPLMKTWTVAASDETGMMLFIKAVKDWCKIEVIEAAPVAEEITKTLSAEHAKSENNTVALDFGKTIPQMKNSLEYYEENEMVREADEMRYKIRASLPKKQPAGKIASLYNYEENGELPSAVVEWAQNRGGAMANRIRQYLSPGVQKSKTMKIFWARQIMDLATPEAWVSYYNARAGSVGGQSTSDAKKQPAAPTA